MSTAIAKPKFADVVIDQVKGTNFKELMPSKLRSIAERFLMTAKLYIATCNHRAKLQECTLPSIVTSILQGAKHGLFVDGKQSHLVPFNTKVKDANGRESWEMQAQWIPDYKGLVTATVRNGSIVDCFAEHVHERDTFTRRLVNGKWHVEYIPELQDRGEYLGTFATVLLPGERFNVGFMTADEIESIRQRSKAKDFGPWKDDTMEMRKKTVIKRALKLYLDDIDLIELFAADDVANGYDDAIDTTAEEPKRGTRKAAPLSLGFEETPKQTFELQDNEPEKEPVKRESKPKNKATANVPENDFGKMFAHCRTDDSINATMRDILADDPGLVENEDFKAAVIAKREELKGAK